MMYEVAVVIGIALIALIIILAMLYEKIIIPAICFAAAILFTYFAIASEVYVMLIIPAFCIFYGIVYIKSNPIHKKTRKKWREL